MTVVAAKTVRACRIVLASLRSRAELVGETFVFKAERAGFAGNVGTTAGFGVASHVDSLTVVVDAEISRITRLVGVAASTRPDFDFDRGTLAILAQLSRLTLRAVAVVDVFAKVEDTARAKYTELAGFTFG